MDQLQFIVSSGIVMLPQTVPDCIQSETTQEVPELPYTIIQVVDGFKIVPNEKIKFLKNEELYSNLGHGHNNGTTLYYITDRTCGVSIPQILGLHLIFHLLLSRKSLLSYFSVPLKVN